MIKINSEFMLSCPDCGDLWFPKQKEINNIMEENVHDVGTIQLGNCRCGRSYTMSFTISEGRVGSIPTQPTEKQIKAYDILKKLKDTFL